MRVEIFCLLHVPRQDYKASDIIQLTKGLTSIKNSPLTGSDGLSNKSVSKCQKDVKLSKLPKDVKLMSICMNLIVSIYFNMGIW